MFGRKQLGNLRFVITSKYAKKSSSLSPFLLLIDLIVSLFYLTTSLSFSVFNHLSVFSLSLSLSLPFTLSINIRSTAFFIFLTLPFFWSLYFSFSLLHPFSLPLLFFLSLCVKRKLYKQEKRDLKLFQDTKIESSKFSNKFFIQFLTNCI